MDLPPDMPVARRGAEIPIPVVLIALYEFAKAAYLLFAFYEVWAPNRAGPTGALGGDPLVLALPVFALVMIIAGAGLLWLQPWARHMFLFGGLLSLPWLPIRTVQSYGPIVDYRLLQPYLPQRVMMAIVVIDLLVYAALIFYPDVSESFGEKGGDPFFND